MAKNKKVAGEAISRKDRKKVKNTGREDIKTVRSESQPLEDKPMWRFSGVDKDGPFKWPKGQEEELDIVDKLHNFDSMHWAAIQGNRHHILSTSSLSKDAKKRLSEIELDDCADSLFSFALTGEKRVIAIKTSSMARLLWYDPKHQVAPSKKKHT